MCSSLSTSKCSAQAHFFTLVLVSQRAYCVRERRERERHTQKREEERKSKSNHASGRDKWELSKNVAALLARLKVVTLI